MLARFAACVGLVGLLIIPAACSATTGDTVFVLGDSITALGEGDIRAAVGDEQQLGFGARFGAKSGEMMLAAQLGLATNPQQVIINLGTNDSLQHAPTAETSDNLRKLIEMFKGARCIHLVTINTDMDDKGNRPKAEAEAINAQIDKFSEEFKNVDLIRWHEINHESVSTKAPLGLTFDGVHPNPEGNKELAKAYRSALRSCRK